MVSTPNLSHTPCHVGIVWKPAGSGEIVIRTPESQLICLTPMGADIFTRCDGKTPISGILEVLKEKYSHMSHGEIETKTYRFLQWLESLGVIIIDWDDF